MKRPRSSGTRGGSEWETAGLCLIILEGEQRSLKKWAFGPVGLTPSHSLCLSFQVFGMGAWLGLIGIRGQPGRGCKALSGQPEVLSGQIPPGVLRRHMGEARATPSPVPLWCWPLEKEQIPGGSWVSWDSSGHWGRSCSQAPLLGHCSPCLALGDQGGEDAGDPSPAMHPGRTSLRAFRALRGLCTRHCFVLHPPPTPLARFPNFPASSGRVGGGHKNPSPAPKCPATA